MGVITASIIAAGASVAVGATNAIMAGNEAKRQRQAARTKGQQIADLEASRQAVINPYDNMENLSHLQSDLSGMATDMSGQIQNEYENLGVATQAAQFEAEEADLSLANTLDAMQASGASAGGATALASAALRSKRGISASLEQQEAANAKLRAQGAMRTQDMRLAEKQRIENIRMSEAQKMQDIRLTEAQRMQNADVAGRTFQWNAQENRDNAQLSRLAGQQANHQRNEQANRMASMNAITQGISGATDAMMSGFEMQNDQQIAAVNNEQGHYDSNGKFKWGKKG